MKPELTRVIETELGYQVSRKSIITINVYDILTNNPIIYYISTDSTKPDAYRNFGHAGTQGIEAEYRLKDKWGHLIINYAFYSAANLNVPNSEKVAIYQTNKIESLLGFSNHRVNLNACFNLTKDLSFNTTASWYDYRRALTGVDAAGEPVQQVLNPKFLFNFFIRYTGVKNLSVGLGVYDALNSKFEFVQPYNGGHPPLPGPAREIIFRLQYNLNFKAKTSN